MRSYRPEELFDDDGAPIAELLDLPPTRPAPHERHPARERRRARCSPLPLPDLRDHAVEVPSPGATVAEATRVLGEYMRDVMRATEPARNFRVFGPDETASNRLGVGVRGDRPGLGGAESCRPTTTWPPAGGSWRCSASTCARAGWRATC